jgi:hypothetical protein
MRARQIMEVKKEQRKNCARRDQLRLRGDTLETRRGSERQIERERERERQRQRYWHRASPVVRFCETSRIGNPSKSTNRASARNYGIP